MSELNERKQVVSAYKELSGILNALKSEEITLNDAMNKIQLKETRPSRPYCKVTGSGALALYGISKQPIVMYADQWNKLCKVVKSDYIDNYVRYNESRLKFKRPVQHSNQSPSRYQSRPQQHDSTKVDELIDDNDVENLNEFDA
jgi:hypothetical protein